MGESNRQKKFSRVVQKEISGILQQEVFIPGSPMVTISVVRASPDLGSCKIHFSVFPDHLLAGTLQWFKENEWEVRQKLAKRIRNQVKVVPEIHFFADDTLSESEYIEKLLDKVKKADSKKEESED